MQFVLPLRYDAGVVHDPTDDVVRDVLLGDKILNRIVEGVIDEVGSRVIHLAYRNKGWSVFRRLWHNPEIVARACATIAPETRGI